MLTFRVLPVLSVATVLMVTLASAQQNGQVKSDRMTAERHKAVLDGLLSKMRQTVETGPYQPTTASLDNYSPPDWYADAKLGIFIHYGLFSVPGYSKSGCWYGNKMYLPNEPSWVFQRETFGPQDKFGYKDFAPYLTGSQFDADRWVSLFKDAGARFVVPVSGFHDGYAMWNSQLTDWNAVKTGPKFDYDGLLATATRRQGLKFGVAWHGFLHSSFFAPGRTVDSDVREPNAGPPWSIYGPASEGPLSREFLDDSLGRLVELVDGYRPDLVWFDFDTAYVPPDDLRRFSAFYFNRAAEWKKSVAINDKNEGLFPKCTVLDFERGKTAGLRHDLWQTDTSVSWKDWSYINNDSFKTVDEIVRELADIVSKNGVLLLDIGPRPDGSIPPEPEAILRGLGAWLKINGEAVYGTRPCWGLGFGEGPHNSGGGDNSDRAIEYNSHDFRFTQKGNNVYAVAMEWPAVDRTLLIKSISSEKMLASKGIATISLLGSKLPLNWKLTTEGLLIKLPKERPCDGPIVLKMTMGGISVEKMDAERIAGGQVQIGLTVRNLEAKQVTEKIEIMAGGKRVGTPEFSVGPSGVLESSVTFPDPSPETSEMIEARPLGGSPFSAHAALFSPPDSAKSWSFDGSSILSGAGIGKLKKFTLSMWTKVDGLREPFTALFDTPGWDSGGFHFQYVPAGNLQASFRTLISAIDGQSNSTPGKASDWRMVSVTYDAGAGHARIYVDGEQDAQVEVPGGLPVNLSLFALGGWTSGGRRLHGRMAAVKLYGRVLSADEIHALLNSKGSDRDLMAAWDFGTAGRNVQDSTGHGHNLTVVP